MLISFDHLFAKYRISAPGVLHLGANLGQEAATYDKHGVKNVIWVEAIPDIHARLVREVAKYPGHVALLACVSNEDGKEVDFNIASNCGQSSSFLEFGTHSQEHPTVKYVRKIKATTTRVDTLLKKEGLEITTDWFLNADLQGAELLALQGMGFLLEQFNYAYIEVNVKELYKGCPLMPDVDAYLERFGLIPVETQMTGSGWGDRFYIRR